MVQDLCSYQCGFERLHNLNGNVDDFIQCVSETFYQPHPEKFKQVNTSLFATSYGGCDGYLHNSFDLAIYA